MVANRTAHPTSVTSSNLSAVTSSNLSAATTSSSLRDLTATKVRRMEITTTSSTVNPKEFRTMSSVAPNSAGLHSVVTSVMEAMMEDLVSTMDPNGELTFTDMSATIAGTM